MHDARLRAALLSLAALALCAPTLKDTDSSAVTARQARPSDCSGSICDITSGGSYYDGLDEAWDRIGTSGGASKFWYETTERGAWFLVCAHCGCGDPIVLGADSSYTALSFSLVAGGGAEKTWTQWQDPTNSCGTDPECVDSSSRPDVHLCGPYILTNGGFPPIIGPYPILTDFLDGEGEVMVSIGTDYENSSGTYLYEECGDSSAPACCNDREDNTIFVQNYLTSIGTNTATDTSQFWTTDEWVGRWLSVGTPISQVRKITGNNTNTITVSVDWDPGLVGDEVYSIKNEFYNLLRDGVCDGAPYNLTPFDVRRTANSPCYAAETCLPTSVVDDPCDSEKHAKMWRTFKNLFRDWAPSTTIWSGVDYPAGFPKGRLINAATNAETWTPDANKDPTRTDPPPCGLSTYGFPIQNPPAFTPACVDLAGPWTTDLPASGPGTCTGSSTTYFFINRVGADGLWPLVSIDAGSQEIGMVINSLNAIMGQSSVATGQGGVQ